MTDKTKQLIDQAVNDKAAADSVRGAVATQAGVVKDADEKLAQVQGAAILAHETALESSHAAISALMEELEAA